MIVNYTHDTYEREDTEGLLHFLYCKCELFTGVHVFSSGRQLARFLVALRKEYTVVYDHMLQIPKSIILLYLNNEKLYSSLKNEQIYTQ